MYTKNENNLHGSRKLIKASSNPLIFTNGKDSSSDQ